MAPVDLNEMYRQFRPLADWWSNRIQWKEEDHEDLVQEGMLELIKTLGSYERSGKPIQDLSGLASICFSASMKWYYKKSDRTLNFVDYDTVKVHLDNLDVYFGKLFIDEFLNELQRVHGIVARRVVENLLEPGEDVGRVALADVEVKKEQRANGRRVLGYAGPRFQKQHIRKALNIETAEWDRTMINIRSFTESYLCRQRANESSSPSTRRLSRAS